MRKQADIAKAAADSHQGQADKSEDELRSFDNALNEQMKRRKEVPWPCHTAATHRPSTHRPCRQRRQTMHTYS
jgi:hypothetical protein